MPSAFASPSVMTASQPGPGPRYKWIALSNTTLGVLMATINSSIMLIALPDIFRGIGVNPLQPGNTSLLLWLLMGYLVVTAVLVVSFGRLGDMFGRVKMFNLGFAIFTFFSLMLSITWLTGTGGALWIVLMRLGQGVGGAFLFANSSAILTDAFPENERGMALGIVKNDANLFNPTHSSIERLAHIGVPLGKTVVPVNELHAGDIGAVAKLRDTLTGDTLTDKASPVAFPPVKLAEPSIAFAVEAKSRNDEDRMGNALHKLLEEDLSLRFYRDPQTKEFLIAGTGQQHVEIPVSRLKKRYAVDVTLKAPKIPYRETIRGTADVQGRHKKQTGGHGQFGDCWIRMEPLPRQA